MNINFNKKTFIILALIWVIITFNLIRSTYAKYVTELDTNASIAISRWDLSLNDQNIINDNDLSNILRLNIVENEYARNNFIVPGSVGYIDLDIDSTNTNVDFTTKADITFKEDSTLTDQFIIFGYSAVNDISEITDDTPVTQLDEGSALSYDISKTTNNTFIRIYVTWEDDGTDSVEDTLMGISNGKLDLHVKLTFEQKGTSTLGGDTSST